MVIESLVSIRDSYSIGQDGIILGRAKEHYFWEKRAISELQMGKCRSFFFIFVSTNYTKFGFYISMKYEIYLQYLILRIS